MKKVKKKLPEKIEPARTNIIEALEELKAQDEPHAEFYESLQKRQTEIVQGIEAMLKNEKSGIDLILLVRSRKS